MVLMVQARWSSVVLMVSAWSLRGLPWSPVVQTWWSSVVLVVPMVPWSRRGCLLVSMVPWSRAVVPLVSPWSPVVQSTGNYKHRWRPLHACLSKDTGTDGRAEWWPVYMMEL